MSTLTCATTLYNHLSGMCTMLYQRCQFYQGLPTVYTLLVYDLYCVMIHLASLWRRVACEMSVSYNVSLSLPSHCSLLYWNWKTEKVCAVCTYVCIHGSVAKGVRRWERSGEGGGKCGAILYHHMYTITCMLSQHMAAELFCVVTR